MRKGPSRSLSRYFILSEIHIAVEFMSWGSVYNYVRLNGTFTLSKATEAALQVAKGVLNVGRTANCVLRSEPTQAGFPDAAKC